MSAPQRFWVRSADTFEVLLEVDTTILTAELATHINCFWGGATLRLAVEDGDRVKTVARMFGARAIFHMQADGGADFGENSPESTEFWTKRVIELEGEGWPDYEDLGIRIVRAYAEACDYFDVTLEADASAQPPDAASIATP